MVFAPRRTAMPRKSYKPEEIIAKLRQVDVLTSQGQGVAEAIRSIGVREVTYYRWRQEFGGLKGNAAVERLATGCRFTEGPVWFGDGRYLLWSDIPNDRILKWEEETGAVSVFRRPSHYANGNTRDRQGRLITCEMDAQQLTRTEYDGTITVLADSFEGKKLTAPNDVVVKSDGSIWLSDNGAGTRGNYLGHTATWELPLRVYRLDPASGQMTIAVGDMWRPNGLAI